MTVVEVFDVGFNVRLPTMTVVVAPLEVRFFPVIVTDELAFVCTEVGASFVIEGVGRVAAPATVVVAATVNDSEARPIEVAQTARPARLVSNVRNMFLLLIGDWLRGSRSVPI